MASVETSEVRVEPALSPVIRALRFVSDEVQFGLVLAAICQEPQVAAAFAKAVVDRSTGGNSAARRQARREAGVMTCMPEQHLLARVSRRARRARAKDVGRVDLRFVGSNGWRLAVELKLNSAFGPDQLDRYAEWGPVVAVVRDVSQVPPLKDRTNWLGAASWTSLVTDLRGLPVDPRWSPEWLALVEVMESDGDFDAAIPSSREAAQQAKLLERLAEPVVDHLRSELRRMYKAAGEAAANSLKRSRVVQGNVWAGFGIDGYDGPWMWVAIRNLWSPAPRLRVAYYTFPDWRARRRLRDAHARIELEGFEPREDYFQFEQPIPALAGAPDDEIVKIVADVITRLVRCRVFDVEIERSRRRKR